MKSNPIFPLITALSGYRLVIIDDKPGLTDKDIMITRSLYNKMKALSPELFDKEK